MSVNPLYQDVEEEIISDDNFPEPSDHLQGGSSVSDGSNRGWNRTGSANLAGGAVSHRSWLPTLPTHVAELVEEPSLFSSGVVGWLRLTMGCTLQRFISLQEVVTEKVVAVKEKSRGPRLHEDNPWLNPELMMDVPGAPLTEAQNQSTPPNEGTADNATVLERSAVYSELVVMDPNSMILTPQSKGMEQRFRQLYLRTRTALLAPFLQSRANTTRIPLEKATSDFCFLHYLHNGEEPVVLSVSTFTTENETEVIADMEKKKAQILEERRQREGGTLPEMPNITVLDEMGVLAGGMHFLQAVVMQIPLLLCAGVERMLSSTIGTPSSDSIVGSLSSDSEKRLHTCILVTILCIFLFVVFLLVRLRYLKYTRALNDVMKTRKRNMSRDIKKMQ